MTSNKTNVDSVSGNTAFVINSYNSREVMEIIEKHFTETDQKWEFKGHTRYTETLDLDGTVTSSGVDAGFNHYVRFDAHGAITSSGSARYGSEVRKSDAIVLPYDITNKGSFNEITETLFDRMAEKYPERRSFIVLMGYNADKEDKRQVSEDDVLAFTKGKNVKHFECSAETEQNINELFDFIIKQTAALRGCTPKKEESNYKPEAILINLSPSHRAELKHELKTTLAKQAEEAAKTASGIDKLALEKLAKTASKTKTSKLSDQKLQETVNKTRESLEELTEKKEEILRRNY